LTPVPAPLKCIRDIVDALNKCMILTYLLTLHQASISVHKAITSSQLRLDVISQQKPETIELNIYEVKIQQVDLNVWMSPL